ncbi:MAG: hypothetical protein U9O98_01975 [Asgard group archaeon]|nr:hypothetical protein [Asgard group archaeon]
MTTIAIYWGYISGDEHLTEEQFADIDFGTPSIDTEFIIFDPLASSFFQGTYFKMYEKKLQFPHRNLPSMRSETMLVYEGTKIKIIDPPVELETPVGVLLCLFIGEKQEIQNAISFLGQKINLKFSPCELNLQKLFAKFAKTRFQIFPISLQIGNLHLKENLVGDLEVYLKEKKDFIKKMQEYSTRITSIRFQIKEVSFYLTIKAERNGLVEFDKNITNLNLKNTIYELLTLSVSTSKRQEVIS